MKKDKWSLRYKGTEQLDICINLLSTFCRKVCISKAPHQCFPEYEVKTTLISDIYKNSGPMGGIYSAMFYEPDAAWFTLACDLPFLNREILQNLYDRRNIKKQATAFIHPQTQLMEPLCAIYEPRLFQRLEENLKIKNLSLCRLLNLSEVERIPLQKEGFLFNVNTPEEYQKACSLLTTMISNEERN